MNHLPGLVATPKKRFEWVDAAKGLCMVLVVFWHVTLWMNEEIVAGDEKYVWTAFSAVLTPIRMPLFFFISGFLASSALYRPLSQSRARTLGLYYVYVFWTILFLLRCFLPLAYSDTSQPSIFGVALSLILPTSFWYIWALPVYFLLSLFLVKLLGRRSVYVLIPFAVLSILAPALNHLTHGVLAAPLDSIKTGSVCENLVWFYLGLHCRDLWLRLLSAATVWKLILGTGAYFGFYILVGYLDLRVETKVVLSVIALYVSVQALGLTNMEGWSCRILRRIGSQTLPVYIFHIFLVSVVSAVAKVIGLQDLLHSHIGLWSVLMTPLLAIPIIYISYTAGHIILVSKFRWLMEAPQWLVPKKIPAMD